MTFQFGAISRLVQNKNEIPFITRCAYKVGAEDENIQNGLMLRKTVRSEDSQQWMSRSAGPIKYIMQIIIIIPSSYYIFMFNICGAYEYRDIIASIDL